MLWSAYHSLCARTLSHPSISPAQCLSGSAADAFTVTPRPARPSRDPRGLTCPHSSVSTPLHRSRLTFQAGTLIRLVCVFAHTLATCNATAVTRTFDTHVPPPARITIVVCPTYCVHIQREIVVNSPQLASMTMYRIFFVQARVSAPPQFMQADSFDVSATFYVNKYADHHAHETAF
ncbi:hypothetical protein B0H21DRAFT_322177 [Amylocystis lapponica]|nr:hypothetical protein B0H21DRAFT_322177 [Amylocystis lapponica]